MGKQSSKTKLKNKHQNKQSKGRKRKKKNASVNKKHQTVTVERQNFNDYNGVDEDSIDHLIDDIWTGNSSLHITDSENGETAAKRRKQDNDEEQIYEQLPRKLNNSSYLENADTESDKIQLLPIKNKQGLIKRTRQKVEDGDTTVEKSVEQEKINDDEIETNSKPELTLVEIYAEREKKLHENKGTIATLCDEILQNPDSNVNSLKKLLEFTSRQELVLIRKLAVISLCEIFKDIVPGYRIRPLSDKEKGTKVSKDVRKIRDFEEGLIANYRNYLDVLEELVNDFVKKKPGKGTPDQYKLLAGKVPKSLALTAAKCMAELVTNLSHFNYRSNLIVAIVSNLNLDGEKKEISDIYNNAVKELFVNDSTGEVSLEAVKVISRMAKGKLNQLRPHVLETLLHLRINSHVIKEAGNRESKIERIKKRKEEIKKLSRKERKRKKLESRLDKELQETEAVESRQKIERFQTEILKFVFIIYFRVLKQEQKTLLLAPVLKGLSKYAHLISVDFFQDLMMSLKKLISSGELSLNESLNCVLTALKILSGQGEALNIDPHHFYLHLYNLLVNLGADCSQDDLDLCVECLDVMLLKRRKQISLGSLFGFLKRIATMSLQLDPESLFSFMAIMRGLLQLNQKCDLLLDNDSIGRGVFQPELTDPEHCNAESTALWELSMVLKHYSVDVHDYARHLLQCAPSHGSGALPIRLLQRKQIDDLENPPLDYYFPERIPSSSIGKKTRSFDDKWENTFFKENLDRIFSYELEVGLDYYKCLKSLGNL